jgi:excinuclease ABC subunit B
MPPFEIVSDFKMTGDQPQAVEKLAEVNMGEITEQEYREF